VAPCGSGSATLNKTAEKKFTFLFLELEYYVNCVNLEDVEMENNQNEVENKGEEKNEEQIKENKEEVSGKALLRSRNRIKMMRLRNTAGK
jgi:hypothetical protein